LAAWKQHQRQKDATPSPPNKNDAHEMAFQQVVGIVDRVIVAMEFVRVSELYTEYTAALADAGFPSENYRLDALLKKVTRHYGDAVVTQVMAHAIGWSGRDNVTLIYSSKMSVSDVVTALYAATPRRFGAWLSDVVNRAHEQATPIPWPFTADDIEQAAEDKLPTELNAFLQAFITGDHREDALDKLSDQAREKTIRRVSSHGQDMCRTGVYSLCSLVIMIIASLGQHTQPIMVLIILSYRYW
jgi:hypothetical protein